MKYDIAIIGSGPGGYVAAIRAAQLGAKVALIERANIGGICLNWGCIPSKAVVTGVEKYNYAKKASKFGVNIENLSFDYKKLSDYKWSVVEKIRKNLTQLIKSYGIDIIHGEASLESCNKVKISTFHEHKEIDFNYLILATGSRPVSLRHLFIDHKFILDTSDILALDKLPESIAIIGSGASGIEWAKIFNSLGSKVTIIEIEPRLAPVFDSSISERIERLFKRNRIEYYTSTTVEKIQDKTLILSNGKELNPEIVFLAVGRAPNSDIRCDEKLEICRKGSFICVDENLKTSIDNIYAIGDVTGKLPLAHVASYQGIKAVEHILLNKKVEINYLAVPKIIYGDPEICSVGYTEENLIEQKIPYEKSIFPMSATGKSVVDDELEGFIKVLATKEKILGVHIIATRGATLIQQAAMAISSNLTPENIKETIFAHPTYDEALQEAFLGIEGFPIHLPKAL